MAHRHRARATAINKRGKTRGLRPVGRRKFLAQSAMATAAVGLAVSTRTLRGADAEPLVIEGYANQMSAAPGEEIGFHISTNAPVYSLEISRVGAERKVVWEKKDLPGAKHPMPADAAMNGCKWPEALRLKIPADWKSGYYSVYMRPNNDGPPQEMFFILRAGEKKAKILFQMSTNTYQAYNNWGGSCLYSGPKFPRVSFDRPFIIFEHKHNPGDEWWNPNTWCCHTWDLPFLKWAEESGYEIDCCANFDLELRPEILEGYKLLLSIGHDEYWSKPMRDSLEAFIAKGGNAAFFSGNSVCWQVRTEDNGRALVCYKSVYEQDPVFATDDHSTLTALWSNPHINRPENQMTGVGFMYGGYNKFFGEYMAGPGAGEYTVHDPEHWILDGTNLKAGETFGADPGIAGYECDGCEFIMKDGRPVPTGRDGTPKDFQIIATAPARWSDRDGSLTWIKELRAQLPAPTPENPAPPDYLEGNGAAVLGTYTRGGTVVTGGSTDWSMGLAAKNKVVDRIFRNVLDKLTA